MQTKQGNGLAIAGFILALVGFFFCWIPYLKTILWILALVFSIIGVTRAPKRGLAIAGIIIGTFDMILAYTIGKIIWTSLLLYGAAALFY